MKKLIIVLLLIFFSPVACFASLKTNEINILNLKVDNMYILNLNSKALKIDTNQNKLINIFPITTISNDGKEVFINTKDSGVYDINLKTEKDDYKLRIIVGSTFEEITEDLTLIDVPTNMKEDN